MLLTDRWRLGSFSYASTMIETMTRTVNQTNQNTKEKSWKSFRVYQRSDKTTSCFGFIATNRNKETAYAQSKWENKLYNYGNEIQFVGNEINALNETTIQAPQMQWTTTSPNKLYACSMPVDYSMIKINYLVYLFYFLGFLSPLAHNPSFNSTNHPLTDSHQWIKRAE